MFRYIVRRLLQMILTFFGATFVVFALMFANQDDPIQALAGVRQVVGVEVDADQPTRWSKTTQ